MKIRRFAGLAWALAAAGAWIVLATRTPTSTFHFAPLVVAGAWVVYDGYSVAGITQHRAVNEAAIGFALAALATLLLEVMGNLSGPVFWHEGPDSPVVLEHLLFAAGGAVLGFGLAMRRANKAPTSGELTHK